MLTDSPGLKFYYAPRFCGRKGKVQWTLFVIKYNLFFSIQNLNLSLFVFFKKVEENKVFHGIITIAVVLLYQWLLWRYRVIALDSFAGWRIPYCIYT